MHIGLKKNGDYYNKMDTSNLIKGVNGSIAFNEEGAGKLVAFFTSLVRGLNKDYIQKTMVDLLKYDAQDRILKDLAVMAYQTRDIRGGKGEKALFQHMITVLCQWIIKADAVKGPTTVAKLMGLIAEYGCYGDLWKLMDKCDIPGIIDGICKVVVDQFNNDEQGMKEGKSVSLLAKWLPREGSKYGKVVGTLRKALGLSHKEYRVRVSALNKYLKTVEINMCNGTWADIEPSAVPGRNMFLHKKAFLNENTEKRIKKLIEKAMGERTVDEENRYDARNYMRERMMRRQLMEELREKYKIRYPNRDDRVKCREKFVEFFGKVAKGEAKIKGADVLMPHEIVKEMNNLAGCDYENNPEAQALEGQWKAISEKMGSFEKMICLADFSASMDGIPMLVSMALGILVSEKTSNAFRNHLITFNDTPSWIKFEKDAHLWDKIRACRESPWGGSTNFESAYELVLQRMIENKIEPGQEPDDLLVLTDMGWNEATGRHPFHLDNLKKKFKDAGEKLWGEGKGWKIPRVIIWNLREEFKQYQATEKTKGVVMISGWHPSILKRLQEGVEITTPWDAMRWILDAERYNPVREIFNAA
jgi:hypothetical protein